MSNVCEHGSLARSCEVCELKAELAMVKRHKNEANALLRKVYAERDEARDFARLLNRAQESPEDVVAENKRLKIAIVGMKESISQAEHERDQQKSNNRSRLECLARMEAELAEARTTLAAIQSTLDNPHDHAYSEIAGIMKRYRSDGQSACTTDSERDVTGNGEGGK